MKLKDLPENSFFNYDETKAMVKFGNAHYKDMYFKLENYDNRNCRIIHMSNFYKCFDEVFLGKNASVEPANYDISSKRTIKMIFSYKFTYRKRKEL